MAGTSGFIDPENLHTGFDTEFFYLSSEQEKPAVDLDFILTKLVKRNRGMKQQILKYWKNKEVVIEEQQNLQAFLNM